MQDICRRVAIGELTLEETQAAHRKPRADLTSALQEEALKYGWVDHKQPFMWPTPKTAGVCAFLCMLTLRLSTGHFHS